MAMPSRTNGNAPAGAPADGQSIGDLVSDASKHVSTLIQGEIEGPATSYCLDPKGFCWLKEHFDGWLPDIEVCCPPDRKK